MTFASWSLIAIAAIVFSATRVLQLHRKAEQAMATVRASH